MAPKKSPPVTVLPPKSSVRPVVEASFASDLVSGQDISGYPPLVPQAEADDPARALAELLDDDEFGFQAEELDRALAASRKFH